MSATSKSGIRTTEDGESVIPASRRADGSTRKEIRVRPGYRPPEDVETYKNRSAEAWKNRGGGGIPGADPVPKEKDTDAKSKNAKRRDAAKRKAALDPRDDADLAAGMQKAAIADEEKLKQDWRNPDMLAGNVTTTPDDEADRQKKIRNSLKKLKGVRDLKEKKAAGEKLSPDQLMKIGKEAELLRDLKKLRYDGPELANMNGNAFPDLDEG